MRSPEFKLFPWGVLALAMPAIASVAALGYDRSPNVNHELMSSILLSTLAAGNAYILAIAGGRLGNAVLSIPIGAIVGFLAVPALSFQPLFIIYLGVAGMGCVGLMLEYLMNYGAESTMTTWLMLMASSACVALIALFCVMLGGNGLPATSPFAAPICFPVVMSCIGAAMVVRSLASGAPDGFMTGFRASAAGMLRAALVGFPLLALFNAFSASVFASRGLYVVVGFLMLCNYFTLRSLFPQWQRVTDDSKRTPNTLAVEVIKAE